MHEMPQRDYHDIETHSKSEFSLTIQLSIYAFKILFNIWYMTIEQLVVTSLKNSRMNKLNICR